MIIAHASNMTTFLLGQSIPLSKLTGFIPLLIALYGLYCAINPGSIALMGRHRWESEGDIEPSEAYLSSIRIRGILTVCIFLGFAIFCFVYGN